MPIEHIGLGVPNAEVFDQILTTLTKGVAQLASGQLSQGSQFPIKLAAPPRPRPVSHWPRTRRAPAYSEA